MPRTHREYQSSFRIIFASEIGMRDFKIESAPCPAPMANHAKTPFRSHGPRRTFAGLRQGLRGRLSQGNRLKGMEYMDFVPRNTCDLIKSSVVFKLSRPYPYRRSCGLIAGETACDGKKKAYEAFAAYAPCPSWRFPRPSPRRPRPCGATVRKRGVSGPAWRN